MIKYKIILLIDGNKAILNSTLFFASIYLDVIKKTNWRPRIIFHKKISL